MLRNKKPPLKSDKTPTIRGHKRGVVGYSRKTALLEEAITQMNAGKYGRSSAALKELLALDPNNMEARRLFATLHLRLGSLIPARQAFDSLISEAFQRQDYWLAESLLREYLAAGPRCVPFLEKLGALYQEKGDTLEAVAEYGKAIDILIEDPDSDNPHLASQLYAKVRELAPASPMAFRLASFFDAQTGELLTRQPGDSGQSTVAPSLDMPEEGQGIQISPEPMDGVMPWEIQDSQATAPDALKVTDVSDSSGSLIPPVITNVPAHQEATFDEELVPSDSHLREQTANSANEERGDASEETRTSEFGSAPSEAQMDDHSGQVILGDSHPVTLPSEPAIERSEIERGPGPTESFATVQEKDRLLVVEAEPGALHDVSGPSTVSAPTEPADALESTISSGQFIAAQSAPGAESSAIQPGSDPAVSFVVAQEQDRLSVAEAEPEALHDVSGPSTVSAPMEPPNASESSNSPQSIEDANIVPSFKIEETSVPTFLGAELPTAEPIEAEDRQPSLQQSVETTSKVEVTEPPPDTRAPSNPNPESVSVDEISEPWKQPGFSWESLFNSAWKFGSDHSAHVPPPEITKTNVEEASPPASAAAPLPEQVLENQAIEIPEREASMSLGDQTSSGSPIAPMPWDQVQESVISILPKQTDQPVAESEESTLDRSVDEINLDEAPKVGEEQAQPLPPPDISVAGTESFSIAQTPKESISPEPEIFVVDTEQTSFTTERASTLTEPEPQFRIVSVPTMDEPPSLVTPMEEIASPPLENRPVADDVVALANFSLQSAAQVFSTDDDHTIAADQSCGQEPVVETSVDSSQPTSETLSRETNEIPLSSPLPNQQRICEPQPEVAATTHLAEETTEVRTHKQQPQAMAFVEEQALIPELAHEPVPEPAPEEEWGKTRNSIRFIESTQTTPVTHVPPAISGRQEVSRSMAAAAAAVDVLFESSRRVRATETQQPVAESKPRRKSSLTLTRIRMAIGGFLDSCFSTTRAMVVTCIGLVMLSGILIALGISAIGLTWVIMEESPSPVFQSLTTTPQRTLSDLKKNGYFFLLGIDASAGQDPIQAGYDRKPQVNDGNSALACFGGSGSRTIEGSNASANVMRGWVRSSNPVGEFKSHQDTIKGWGNEHQPMLSRYSQWQKLAFEDWGYGQLVGLPCTAMVFAHQLHVADGFLQSADLGVDRLETDMEAWRIVLGQARTLAVKMLALQAINDDIAVASGLLVSSDFDGKYLGRVTKFLRPLDQTELSLRWPMQSELVSASKTYETQLKAARAEEQPLYTMVVSALPLPKQRRLNDYADYYDASYKAAGEGKYGSLPKWKGYIHFPASGLMDYFTNPIENIVGLEPLPPWDRYNGFVVDTDARLRLASLQAWLRRGPADGELLTRIAKAGQNFYDPYTGLPMLVNMKKGALYSVGHDGKDQDADPQSDVVVEIPVAQTSPSHANHSAASSKSR